MHVCFLSGNIYPLLAGRAHDDMPIIGGAETQQITIARELTRRGVEISFITQDYGQGFETDAGGFRIRSYTFGWNKIEQGRTLWRAMDRSRPDVYYVRGVPRYIGWVALNSIARGRPLVIGMAQNRTALPRPLSGFSLAEDLTYRWALSRAAALVAQTEFQRDELAKNYGRARAIVIRNGAPPSKAKPHAHEARKSAAWIATLHPHKGIRQLFELAAARPDFMFQVAGAPERDAAPGYYEEMRARAAALGNVRWLGVVPHEEIDDLLSHSLALIHTTVPHPGVAANLHEGFPNVYLEAWRNGVPVLTLDTDPDEVICREGLGFHSRSIDEMARDLDRLRDDAGTWNRISAATKRHFDRVHSIERIGDEYLALFRDVATRKGS